MPEHKREDEFSVANLLQAQRDLLVGANQQTPGAPQGAPPAPSTEEGDAFVNLKHYAYIIYGRKLWVLLVTMIVVLAAVAQWWLRPRRFETSAEVLLDENIRGYTDIFGSRGSYLDAEALGQLAAMPTVINLAAAKLPGELQKRLKDEGPRLSGSEKSALEAALEEAKETARRPNPGVSGLGLARLEKYRIHLTASAEGRNRVARILAESRALAHARALVEHFSASIGSQGHLDRIKKMIDDNAKGLEGVNRQMAGALLTVTAPDAGENPNRGSSSDQLESIQAQRRALVQAELQLSEVRDRTEKLGKLLSTPPEAGSVTVNPELPRRLVALEADIARMREIYGDKYPKLQRKIEERDSLQALIADAERTANPNLTSRTGLDQLYSEHARAKLEISVLEARRETLRQAIEEARKNIVLKAGSSESLKYERQSLEEMAVFLQRKLREAQMAAGGPDGQDVRQPVSVGKVRSAEAVGASLGQTFGFAVVMGLVMGVLLALLLEHLDDTIRSELSARRASNLPVISKLPLFTGTPEKIFISPAEPRSDVSEMFKVFHNHVRYAAPNAPEKCLLITSPGPEEGKSYVALNLALSFASEGNRVCFLDADLRRSKTHERLDVLRPKGPVEAGLCGYLERDLPYEEVVLPTEHENLWVVLASGRAGNPPRVLRSERMRQLLERLDREFDAVIIDAPPVLPVVDAAITANLVRAVILVVRFGVTHMGDLVEASGRLAHVGAPLAGVVINAVHGGGGGYYYGYRYGYRYRYSYRYGYGYGYGSPERPGQQPGTPPSQPSSSSKA